MSEKQLTCAERVRPSYDSTMEVLRELWEMYCNDPDESHEDYGNLYEYGLSFDYVAPETFNDQKEGYFRYQLSWGGPSDEFRIYAQKIDDWRFSVYKIEYWFLDWFDGAKINLSGEDYDFIEELFSQFFVDSGTANYQLEQAMDY